MNRLFPHLWRLSPPCPLGLGSRLLRIVTADLLCSGCKRRKFAGGDHAVMMSAGPFELANQTIRLHVPCLSNLADHRHLDRLIPAYLNAPDRRPVADLPAAYTSLRLKPFIPQPVAWIYATRNSLCQGLGHGCLGRPMPHPMIIR